MGIDANGQIGADPVCPWVGSKGATKWNSNGTQLAKTAEQMDPVITNTLDNCNNAGATWLSRDGRCKTKIDYILLSRWCMGNLIGNIGATQLDHFEKEGAPGDHKPVIISLKLISFADRFRNRADMGRKMVKLVFSGGNWQKCCWKKLKGYLP